MSSDPRLPRYERPEMPFERKASPLMRAGRWSAIGLEFGLSVVLFFLGGQYLDAKLRTSPWLALVGAMVGVAAGTWLLLRSVLKASSEDSSKGSSGAKSDRD
jgi:F0F1-type ATP synthase assembly protein I